MPYFTPEELRSLPDLSDADLHPNERLTAAHDWIAALIERECETSFIPVAKTAELDGDGRNPVCLPDPYILSLTSVTAASVVVDPDLLLLRDGLLRYRDGFTRWPWGYGTVVVEYTAGYSTQPPADLKEAALRAARNWVLTTSDLSAVDTRATGISNQDGNITLVIAGEDRPTGLPEVDATIMAWARRVRVPKVS